MAQNWQSRITRHGSETPSQLLANPNNWRIHNQVQQGLMEGALNELGWLQEVVVNERTGYLIDGHMRVTIALRNGDAPIPVLYVDLDADEEAAALATLDPIAQLAETDDKARRELLESVAFLDHNLAEFAAELLGPADEPPSAPTDDEEPPTGQLAVFLSFASETAQAAAYDELAAAGYTVKVVNT